MPTEEEKIIALIEPGSEIVGGVASAAIGLISAGPAGAIAGAAAGPVITRVFKNICLELYDRISGYRGRVRAGATAAFAISTINDRIANGDLVRDDQFFDPQSNRREADEILEGVVLKSRDEHEERKAPYYANIFSTASFDTKYTRDALNYALSIAENLTFRQLLLLQIVSDPKQHQLLNRDYYAIDNIPWETHAVLAELYDLYQRSLIHCQRHEEESDEALLSLFAIEPNSMHLTELGARLHYLMQLQSLPSEELQQVAALIQ